MAAAMNQGGRQRRGCRIYFCRELQAMRCCADCHLWQSCLERCLNWPSRCRCVSQPKPATPEDGKQ